MSGGPEVVESHSRTSRRSRAVELIVLIESVVITATSLTWLAIVTAQSHINQLRWELWMPGRAAELRADEVIAAPVAVAISSFVMLALLGLSVLGHSTALRWDRGPSRISVATRWAAIAGPPLTLSLPIQFAAFQQTDLWAGDGHSMELVVRYGPMPVFVLGIGLLMGTKLFVDAW